MENEKLELANKQAYNRLKSDGVPVKGGKTYLMVVHRIEILRNVFGLELGIKTELIHHDSERVIVSAKIIDCNGMIYGSGLAEEYRNDGNVNATSAVENAESSAIGRALASLGLHGGEYPTADEMNKALNSNRKSMKEPIAQATSGDWEDAIIPIGKHKGKKLGELAPRSRDWYLQNFEANENYEDSVLFRKACDECMGKSSNEEALTDEISEQTAQDTNEDLDEDVPF